jgi:hypothetical protein
MKDKEVKGKEVDMGSPLVKQHKRMAAGKKIDGQSSKGSADSAPPKKEIKVRK